MDLIRARWLLEHPLDYAVPIPGLLDPYKTFRQEADGAVLTAVLAVDR